MVINKITPGYVIQKFDTDRGEWIDQKFFAGDGVTYENELGDELETHEMPFGDRYEKEPYLPFIMKMPN